jgi:hypothetical protein
MPGAVVIEEVMTESAWALTGKRVTVKRAIGRINL